MKNTIALFLIAFLALNMAAQKTEKNEKQDKTEKNEKPEKAEKNDKGENEEDAKVIDVPQVVKAAIIRDFANAEKPKWEKEGDYYEAEFELNEVETSALYDANGNLLETETEVAKSTLPAGCLAYIKTNYPKHKISETCKITDNKKTVKYEVEIKGAGKKMDIIFDDKGNFISMEE